jgi:N-acyl-D-aspartate/D-glutamate deacylase
MPWSWESFPEWLDALEATPKGVNVLTLVPLNPLLVYVMGLDASKSRDPSAEELAKMKSLLREALEAGACGLSAQMTPPGSGADFQRDYDGSPFATDVMSKGTMLDLTRVLADFDGTAIQTVLSTNDGLEADQRFMEELAVESKGTVVFNAIGPFQGDRRGLHKGLIEWIRSCRERSIGVWAQMVTNGEIFTVTFEDWNMFDEMPAWREAMLGSPSERLEKLSDPARREALRSQPPSAFPLDDAVILRTESEQFQAIKGTKLQDAARILGYENQIDLLLDVVIADELRTLIQIPHVADDPDSLREIATEPYGIWGVSDGGAHTKFITLGSYPTENITKFVREDAWMTLEEAHSRLSFLPARAGGFKDRGALLPGAPADIVVYDYDNLELLDEEVAHDYPAGEWRRIRRAKGYRRVLVNGQSTIVDDEFTGATPGCLLRGGRAPE